MALKETKNESKKLIEATPEEMKKADLSEIVELEKPTAEIIEEVEKSGKKVIQEKDMTFEEKRALKIKKEEREKLDAWVPKTQLGKDTRAGKLKDIDDILENGKKILESEIIDLIVPNLESDLILIGQAKGKFGGGKRRAWRQTQKKAKEGNILTFSAMAVVGDRAGHVGLGTGKAKETLPSREKANRQAKLNLIKIERGCAHFDCSCGEPHTVPFVVEGKSGSVRVKLRPAPQGTGLVVGDQLKKILKLAGIKDVYGISKGHTRTTFNHSKACFDALKKTTGRMK